MAKREFKTPILSNVEATTPHAGVNAFSAATGSDYDCDYGYYGYGYGYGCDYGYGYGYDHDPGYDWNLGELPEFVFTPPPIPPFPPSAPWPPINPPPPPPSPPSGGGGGNPGGENPGDGGNQVAVIAGPPMVPLGSSATFTASITPATSVNNVAFRARRRSNPGEFSITLQTGGSLTCTRNMLSPGFWEVIAEVTLAGGTVITSSPTTVEVRLPHVNDIKTNTDIINAMGSSWNRTIGNSSESGRQEFGFWIFANTTGGSLRLEAGAEVPGALVPCGTQATLDPRPPTNLIPSNSPLEGIRWPVAHFHTHTPNRWCPNHPRRVGPSQADRDWADNNDIPGLVYDYEGEARPGYSGNWLKSGHVLNAPARVYTFGPLWRPAPFS